MANLLHDNIKYTFRKKILFPKTQKKRRLSLQILECWTIEDSWIHTCASPLNLLPCVVLVEIQGGNQSSRR